MIIEQKAQMVQALLNFTQANEYIPYHQSIRHHIKILTEDKSKLNISKIRKTKLNIIALAIQCTIALATQ